MKPCLILAGSCGPFFKETITATFMEISSVKWLSELVSLSANYASCELN